MHATHHLSIVPIEYREAAAFVARHHRHHTPPITWKFGMAASLDDRVVGVAMVALPKARLMMDGWTLEVVRCCTDGTPNACSVLYGACWRAAKALGYRRLVTYVLASESGGSLKASGWRCLGERGGGTWNRKGRPHVVERPHLQGPKMLWEAV